MVEQVPSKDLLSELLDVLRSYHDGRCYACGWSLAAEQSKGCIPGDCSYRPPEVHPSYKQWRERMEVMTRVQHAITHPQQYSSHEPPDDRPTDEALARFSTWLAREMPTSTVIGDPNWWARKLLNAAYVYLPGSSQPPPADRCDVCTKPLPPIGAWSMPSCPDCQDLLEGLGQLMGDFADREQTIKAGWLERAINLICARPAQPPVPEPKFKVGDRIEWTNMLKNTFVGTVLKIVTVAPEYEIQFDDRTRGVRSETELRATSTKPDEQS